MKIIIIAIIISLFLHGEIKNIKFNGLNFISSDRAMSIIDINIGDEFDEDKANQAIKSLYKSSYFNNISANYNDGILVFDFIEQKSFGDITFKHKFSNKSKQEIYSMVNIKKGDIYSSYKLNKAKSLILQKLKDENLISSYVEIEEEVDNNIINITFEIKAGSKVFVENIFISGNNKFPEDIIKKELLIKEKHPYLSYVPFFSDGELNFKMLNFNDAKLIEFYWKHGYLDAKVTKHLMEINRNNKKASLYLNIDEGIAYKLKSINIFNIDDLETNILKQYEKDLSLEVGEVFNINDFRRDLSYIREKFQNKGYAKAVVIPKLDKKDGYINLSLTIDKKEVYTINDIFIGGNNKTQDTVIRRNLYIYLGDKYNQKDIKDSKTSLLRTGNFDEIEVEEEFIEDNKINLIVKVVEKKTTQWIAGGGYSDLDGVFINLSIQDSNTFGSGISSKVSTTLSADTKKYTLSLHNPMIFNTDYSAGFKLYKKDESNLIYAQESIGSEVNIGKKINRNTNIYLGFNIDDSLIDDVNNSEFNITEKQAYLENSISMKLKYSSTDRFFEPTKGMTYSISAKLSGGILGGNVNILDIKNYITFHKTLKPYINFDSILNFKFALHNVINMENNSLPIHKRVFLGGSKNIRGFERNSIYPKDDNIIGGTDSFNTSMDISTLIPGQKTFRIITFLDYGIIGVKNKKFVKKSSYGVALNVSLGTLPVAIYWSSPILYDKDNDELKPIELVIGNTF